MYFPVLELHGWGKRSAIQPQTIYSEVPKNYYSTIYTSGKGKITFVFVKSTYLVSC